MESYEEYIWFEEKDFEMCKKLNIKCNELWEKKYKSIFSQNHSKIYSPLYKDDYKDKDCSGWNLYLSEMPKNINFIFDDELDCYVDYILNIKVKIIILNNYIECYYDYHNKYSIDEIIAVRDKYVNICILQENKYRNFMHESIYKKQEYHSGGTNFDGDEIDIFVSTSWDHLYFSGKQSNVI
jgi:hypothetical protein